MNFTKGEKLERLKTALKTGASLRQACDYAGVAKNTAFMWRGRLGIPPRRPNKSGWKAPTQETA